MFAVSGWSITAPLKQQTETTQAPSTTNATNDAPAKSKNLKRKREKEANVTKENVVGLWEKHIEGKVVEKEQGAKKKRKRDRKKKKSVIEDVDIAANEDVNEGATTQPLPTKEKARPPKKQKDKQPPPLSTSQSTEPKLTPLQASMRAKLTSARFRHLNEQLYTSPSQTSLSLFTSQPTLFSEYHLGFRQQVTSWPENPVDSYISELKARGHTKKAPNPNTASLKSMVPLPRSRGGICTVADLGCGDAGIAKALKKIEGKIGVKVHSFDLHSENEFVTRADIKDLPVPDGSVDVAIFCLALMGTNWPDFIDEAYRVLRWQGELWISEIKSRFGRAGKFVGGIGTKRKEEAAADDDTPNVQEEDSETAKKETDVSGFVAVLKSRGFILAGSDKESIDLRNKMFVKMRFLKGMKPTKGKNVMEESAASGENRRGRGDRNGRFEMKKLSKKFIERDEAKEEIDETKILKPCVYKLR